VARILSRSHSVWRMHHEVTETDTAALGVVTSPCCDTAVDAGLKAATVQAVTAFRGGQTTVGTAIRIGHRYATPVGGVPCSVCTVRLP
jgi:fluoroacetyl-CoA thioesterase